MIKQEPTDFYDIRRGVIKKLLPSHKRSRERLFIPQETNFTTLKYKGNFWSRMKGRDDERTSVTPGPGNYEHETKKSPAQIHNEKTREAKRATVKQPRFLEALYQQKLRQVILRARFVTFPVFSCKSGKLPFCICLKSSYENLFFPKRTFQLLIITIHRKAYLISTNIFHVSVILTKWSCRLLIKLQKYVFFIIYIISVHYMQMWLNFNYLFKRFKKDKPETPGPGAYKIATEQICYASILGAPFGAFGTRFKKINDKVTPGIYYVNRY